MVELEGIDASGAGRAPTEFATIGAEHGVYDREKNTLEIPSTDHGQDHRRDDRDPAQIGLSGDSARAMLRTRDPVDIKMEGAQIVADSMRILENGNVLIFERR